MKNHTIQEYIQGNFKIARITTMYGNNVIGKHNNCKMLARGRG